LQVDAHSKEEEDTMWIQTTLLTLGFIGASVSVAQACPCTDDTQAPCACEGCGCDSGKCAEDTDKPCACAAKADDKAPEGCACKRKAEKAPAETK
jgi:hypothetical protein